jgi:hypothetical protein
MPAELRALVAALRQHGPLLVWGHWQLATVSSHGVGSMALSAATAWEVWRCQQHQQEHGQSSVGLPAGPAVAGAPWQHR